MRNGHGIFTTTDYSDYIDFYFDNGLRRIIRIARIICEICDICEKLRNNGLRRITRIARIICGKLWKTKKLVSSYDVSG